MSTQSLPRPRDATSIDENWTLTERRVRHLERTVLGRYLLSCHTVIKYYRSADILRRPIESRRGKILSSRGEIANRHEYTSLQWRHNEHNGVSNHQPDDCLLNRLFRLTSKKPQTPASLALYVGNSPVTGEFATQMASNEENVSIWWRHHVHRVTWGKTPIGLNQGWF